MDVDGSFILKLKMHQFQVSLIKRLDQRQKVVYIINIPTGKETAFWCLSFEETIRKTLKARICPNCGKAEMYVEKFR